MDKKKTPKKKEYKKRGPRKVSEEVLWSFCLFLAKSYCGWQEVNHLAAKRLMLNMSSKVATIQRRSWAIATPICKSFGKMRGFDKVPKLKDRVCNTLVCGTTAAPSVFHCAGDCICRKVGRTKLKRLMCCKAEEQA